MQAEIMLEGFHSHYESVEPLSLYIVTKLPPLLDSARSKEDFSLIANDFSSASSQNILQRLSILYNTADKNAQAHACIQSYASKHAFMDIGVGAVSWLPGAALPAIAASLALQNEIIYKPLAKDLAAIYLRESDSYTDALGNVASVATVAAEFAQEFAISFLIDHAKDMVLDLGLTALASFIPGVGMLAGATLDYLIAQMMTWQIGTMTAIYFQNGGEWVGNRKSTLNIAKSITGGINVSAGDLLFNTFKEKHVRVDFNSIPAKVPEVLGAGLRTLMPIIRGLAKQLPRNAVRESLIAMGISSIIVEASLFAFYEVS